ncbi:hypothetical protein [uncultured Desulfobacter sp.]|uniref:hypothetical protein n=1 Tax=uncultured Desulfobacter sp. TaxID=240139 RepID=UPI002AABFE12|nr:hypothetical protein [uncultured Desulfobacter sp.]
MDFFPNIKTQFQGTLKSWRIYWELYGGLKSIFSSTYFLIAMFFTLICFPVWWSGNDDWAWFNLCNSVLPNILGFTLGGYAILLAFGSSKFMELIAGKQSKEGEGDASPFMQINATFLHFIIVQVVALLVSVFSLVWDFRTGYMAFLGFLLFSYAISVSIAAAFAILRLSRWYDIFVSNNRE